MVVPLEVRDALIELRERFVLVLKDVHRRWFLVQISFNSHTVPFNVDSRVNLSVSQDNDKVVKV